MNRPAFCNDNIWRIHKPQITEDEPFFLAPRSAVHNALKELSGGALKLWLLASENSNTFRLRVSNRTVLNQIGLRRDAYNAGVHMLIEKGFLVPAEGGGFDFFACGKNQQDVQENPAEGCGKNQQGSAGNSRCGKSQQLNSIGRPLTDVSKDVSSIEKEIGERETLSREFTPPTVEDIRSYCEESGIRIDAQAFIDYYAANGWRIGKNPMSDWKAAVRNWQRREGTYGANQFDAEQLRQQQFGKYRYHNQTAENRANEDYSWVKFPGQV